MSQPDIGRPEERIAIERHGAGEPLVLTHGFGDSATTWSGIRPILSKHYETWSWDLLGHGRSARPTSEQEYSPQIALADLESIISAAGQDVVLIGHSLGGYLSQYRCASSLERVRGLVLIATGPGFRSQAKRERWNQYVREGSDRFDAPDVATRMAEMHDDLVMANLEKLRIPILQICGGRDEGYHSALEVLEQRAPSVESMIVPGAGHHVHRSHAPEVAARILTFLEQLG
ncbi:MAG: alpha/beta fold hydrolase [bacterium]|nr:alpha/beta fold hydrolase [bacterium]